MLWIIDGLIYGFFTAVYTIFNQHYKLNAYLLGMWRGWGIALCFAPFLYFLGFPSSAYYWFLLIMQGLMIAVYDSHLFFASARYGAGPTSRVMALTAMVTTLFWWFLTPESFLKLLDNGTLVITYYLTIAVFVSGSVNAWWYVRSVKPGFSGFFRQVFSPRMIRIGFYVVSFSAALITAKNLALRTAPNPGYVIALLLTSPLFVFGLNK